VFFSEAIKTPIGPCCIEATAEGITKIYFSDQPIAGSPNRLTALAAVQLGEYFEGSRKDFDLPLSPKGTDFQKTVWQLLREIPFGKTESYAQLAARFGDPKTIRAVAVANGKNQLSIVVPCHREIGSEGSLTGYAWGLDKKEWLLNHEGALPRKLF
jgi:methylated-DNA-[protein]-cysteine S-methyltransferase